MSRRRNPSSTGKARDGQLLPGRVADGRLLTVAQTAKGPSDPPTRPSAVAGVGRTKRTPMTGPPHDPQHGPSRQQRRPSVRENKLRRLLSIRDVAEILNVST